MPTVPLDQKFHTIAANVATKERGSALVNSQKEIFTMQDVVNTVRPYKVFTALLTQMGGDTPIVTLGDETIYEKVTYTIISLSPGDNLIPYGAPDNNVGTSFICNQEISNGWGNPASELSSNEGAPVATVLENTIGNIWFSYDSIGNYIVEGNFPINKTYAILSNIGQIPGDNISITSYISGNALYLSTYSLSFDGTSEYADNILSTTPIEIRVYE